MSSPSLVQPELVVPCMLAVRKSCIVKASLQAEAVEAEKAVRKRRAVGSCIFVWLGGRSLS